MTGRASAWAYREAAIKAYMEANWKRTRAEAVVWVEDMAAEFDEEQRQKYRASKRERE